MGFTLPAYVPPDFTQTDLAGSPTVTFTPAPADGIAPENYHATSIYPEYFQVKKGAWLLPRESRMDCVVVQDQSGTLQVTEFRHLRAGDRVACGRSENGEEGIFVHNRPFAFAREDVEKFAFRTGLTRESSFSFDYDELHDLLGNERENGFVLWVLGPAVIFDHDARSAFVRLVDGGYVHGLLAGNAMPTHDLEGALYGTALGHELYAKRGSRAGHYRHLDTLNRIRRAGSIEDAVAEGTIGNGVMHALVGNRVPYVLAGSIRDDGPLPEVIADACAAQDAMRSLARRATTVIALATQLHAIATGNMLPCYHVLESGDVRPVFFYTVDMSEFAVSKLLDRGSLTARAILTNVQDFVVTLQRGLG